MLTSTADYIRKERAKFARDVEYLRETVNDDIIDIQVEKAESKYNTETVEELQEAAYMVDKLPIDDEYTAESVEIQRLLDATENMSFEDMTNIK